MIITEEGLSRFGDDEIVYNVTNDHRLHKPLYKYDSEVFSSSLIQSVLSALKVNKVYMLTYM